MDVDPEAWREAFTVNVEARCGWCSARGGRGCGSTAGGGQHLHGGRRARRADVGAYGTSKAALLHLTRQLAGELAPKVRVNSVSPGLVRTEMARSCGSRRGQLAAGLPLGRIGEPEDIARAVVWLASDAAEWITGADLLVDGGTRVRAAHRAAGTRVHERLRSGTPIGGDEREPARPSLSGRCRGVLRELALDGRSLA